MHPFLRTALAASALAVAAVPPVRAADVDAAQAKALQAQIRAWLQGMLGPGVGLPEQPVQVTPDGERYRLEAPIKVARAGKAEGITVTAAIRPAEGGRWMIESLRVPSPASFTLDLPVPPAPGQKLPASGPVPTIPVDYTVTVGSQDVQGSFDPRFTIASTLTTNFRDLRVEAKSALTSQLTMIERSSGTTTLRPSGTGRVDYILDGTIEGYAQRSKAGDAQPVEMTAQRVRVTGEVTSVSRERLAQVVPALLQVTSGFMAAKPTASGKVPALNQATKQQLLRTFVESMQDLASEFTLDETFDGVGVRYGAFGGTARQVQLGMGAKAEGGLLRAHMDLGLDGLALPDLPLGAMAELLPRRIALRPILTGVPMQELLELLVAAGNSKNEGPPPEFAALFRRGTVGTGLESFAIDIGGANFTGMGSLEAASPQELNGQAQVTATSFDSLLQHANAMPELSSVLPVLLFVKGVGRNVENRLVWDITYQNGKTLVNGTDLSSMMGARNR